MGHSAGIQEALRNELHTLQEVPSLLNLWDPLPGGDKETVPGRTKCFAYIISVNPNCNPLSMINPIS